MKINLKNARMRPTGNPGEVSVEGDWQNALILKGDDAKQFRKEYEEQLRTTGVGKFKMELQISVEFEEPTGVLTK